MPLRERDRFGQRPLYYAVRDGRLVTGERADAVLREAGLPRVLQPEAVAAALCGALAPQASLFRGVACVPPGWRLTASEQLERGPSPPSSGGETPLLEALRTAVRRLSAGAACALSGGLDSGLVLALMSEGGAPVRAYTLALDVGDAPELESARALAARCGAAHTLIEISESLLPDHLAETVRACEAPIWNGLAVARQLFFREVRRRGETALLSGVGADELLCGNPAAMLSWRGRRREEREAAEALLTDSARRSLAPPAAVAGDLESLRRSFVDVVLPGSTLPPECRASAAEGIDARLPYLDASFAEVALGLPPASCVRDGFGKLPLREAARGLVPEAVRAAPKTARLAPGGGGSPPARRRWRELYAAWLRPERLEPLECLDLSRLARLRDRRTHGALEDALLMTVASLAVLAVP